MKKLSVIFFILAILICSAGCSKKCEHSWAEATCTEGKTCTLCGLVEGTPAGHKFGPATCTSPATCEACGETSGNPIDHNFGYATCDSPAKCVACEKTDGEALGHKYSGGYCIRCNEKDPKYVACGTVKGTVTYKYNDSVGHRGDEGATVMAIPCGDNANTAKYDNGRACVGINGVYESGIVVTECDGNGNYSFDNLPEGEYVFLIISNATTDRMAFLDKEYYEDVINAFYGDLFSDEDLESLTINIGLSKYDYNYEKVQANKTYTISHDFGITYA